jgi:hypothetical protein
VDELVDVVGEIDQIWWMMIGMSTLKKPFVQWRDVEMI